MMLMLMMCTAPMMTRPVGACVQSDSHGTTTHSSINTSIYSSVHPSYPHSPPRPTHSFTNTSAGATEPHNSKKKEEESRRYQALVVFDGCCDCVVNDDDDHHQNNNNNSNNTIFLLENFVTSFHFIYMDGVVKTTPDIYIYM